MPPKKILIFRTDRMGDVLLNLPLINCLKEHYAPCHLTIVAKRELSGLLSLNTDIDDIIPFDEDMEGRSAFSNIAFASGLKKRRFDLAVVSNPSKALHIISFLAGIPRRVGYRRKWDFLLTDTIEDKKSEGSKHEVEYNLDLARALGIEPKEARFSLSPLEEDTKEVERILHGYGIKDPGRLILLHPHSSNPVKIWPRERFAALSDKICEEAGFTVGVIGGEGEAALTDDLIMAMR
ncbi:MAG: hypothetical protein AUJ75_01180, partial [Candidatus Omnitrophica bacterium CG1_02_49_10]